MRQFERISAVSAVNMTEYWHDIANLEHFWIRRRFEVLCNLLKGDGRILQPAADIGCGCGLLQRQIEDRFNVCVDGFDLDEKVLSENVSQKSRICLYNIHDRQEALFQAYGSVFLFDVLEHIDNQQAFLESALYHLRPGGFLFINLPAFTHLFSAYDAMAGHVRRYTLRDVVSLAGNAHLEVASASYWGMPYYPLLIARKLILATTKTEKSTIERGFQVKSSLGTVLLRHLGKMEFLPQRLLGTSVMAILRKPH